MSKFYQNPKRGQRIRAAQANRVRNAKRCMSPECKNIARTGANFCNTCRSRKYDDPLKVLYWNLKKSAKRRGKAFTLTFEYFRNVAVAGGYDLNHGKGGSDLHVDRINPRLGYEPGNVQILTNSENVRKAWDDRRAAEANPF